MDINRTCTPVHSSLFILSRFWDSAKSGWVMGKRDKNFNRWCWWDNFVTVDCLWDKNEINHRDAWENFTLGSRLEIFVSYRALNWNFVCSTVGCMRVWKRRQIMQNKPVRCQRITDFPLWTRMNFMLPNKFHIKIRSISTIVANDRQSTNLLFIPMCTFNILFQWILFDSSKDVPETLALIFWSSN